MGAGIVQSSARRAAVARCPIAYDPHMTLYNRFVRWSRIGVFDHIFAPLVADGAAPELLMIDRTHLKATAPPPASFKSGFPPLHRQNQGRPELEAARGLRPRGQALDPAAHRGPRSAVARRGDRAARPAGRRQADRRQGLRQRLVSPGPDRSRGSRPASRAGRTERRRSPTT